MIILLLVAVVAGLLLLTAQNARSQRPLIEGNEIGGTCVNVGCVPKSHVASQQR